MNSSEDEMRDDYSGLMSNGVRGKYYAKAMESNGYVRIDPDVRAAFPDARAVNQALRSMIDAGSVVESSGPILAANVDEIKAQSILLALQDSNGTAFEDREDLLDWLYKARRIIEGEGSKWSKFKAVRNSVKRHRNKEMLLVFLQAVKKHLWDDRTWSQRLAIVGGAAAYAAFDTLMGGFATMGMGWAVPVALMVAGGGSLVGNMIDIVEQSRKEPDEQIRLSVNS